MYQQSSVKQEHYLRGSWGGVGRKRQRSEITTSEDQFHERDIQHNYK